MLTLDIWLEIALFAEKGICLKASKALKSAFKVNLEATFPINLYRV
jgi:hypothetical protein